MLFPSMGGVAQHAGMMHAAQGNALQNMANMTMGAISDENRSRVAQSREHRRMMQEQQLKNMDIQALLARLQHERELAEMRMKYEAGMKQMQADKDRGVTYSTRWRKLFD